jgi:hypothetical protein
MADTKEPIEEQLYRVLVDYQEGKFNTAATGAGLLTPELTAVYDQVRALVQVTGQPVTPYEQATAEVMARLRPVMDVETAFGHLSVFITGEPSAEGDVVTDTEAGVAYDSLRIHFARLRVKDTEQQKLPLVTAFAIR